MAQWLEAIGGMEWLSCPKSRAAVNPRDTIGFHEAVATANVIRARGQVPDHVGGPGQGPMRPASPTHHREKKMTATTGAPQRRAIFRTDSMPATISTAITRTSRLS